MCVWLNISQYPHSVPTASMDFKICKKKLMQSEIKLNFFIRLAATAASF
jgi:hypothetical protein